MRITAEATRLFGGPLSLKLAADGIWESALTQPLEYGDPHRLARDQWLKTAGDDVAIEVAFETSAFVGLRLSSEELASAANWCPLCCSGCARTTSTTPTRVGGIQSG